MRMRRSKTFAIATIVLAGALAVAPLRACAASVSAHAALERSTPAGGARLAAAPRQVDLYFSEALATGDSASYAVVLDAAGRRISSSSRIDVADAKHLVAPLPGTLDAGSYAVFWKSTSGVDGGVALGSFGFVVGSVAATPDAGAAGEVFVPDAERTRALTVAGGGAGAWIGGGAIGVAAGVIATGGVWLWSRRRREMDSSTSRRSRRSGRR